MASSADSLPQLISGLELLQFRKELMVGALALFAYDPLLTIQQEYKYIWKSRWTVSKIIYLFLRYGAPAFQVILFGKFLFGTNVSARYCRIIDVIDCFTAVSTYLLTQLTMALRTNALYENQRPIVVLLGTAYLINVFAVAGINFSMVLHLRWAELNNGLQFGCVGLCAGCLPYVRMCWIPAVLFDTLLCIMTVSRAIKHGKVFSTRLLTVLYGDGFMYFAVIYVLGSIQMVLFNIFLWEAGWVATGGSITQGYFRALVSIACCRLILNLRGVLTKPSDFDMSVRSNLGTETMSTIRWARAKPPNSSAGSMGLASLNHPEKTEPHRARGDIYRELELAALSREIQDRGRIP